MQQDIISEVLFKKESQVEVKLKNEIFEHGLSKPVISDDKTYKSVDTCNSNTKEINRVLIKEQLILVECELKTENEDVETVDVTAYDRNDNTNSAVGIEDKVENNNVELKDTGGKTSEYKPLACASCSKSFTSFTDLTEHINTSGRGECYYGFSEGKRYKCTKRRRKFSTKTGIDLHQPFCPNKIKPHMCDRCGKRFALKNSLDLHVCARTGFECVNARNIHFLVHFKGKKFKCKTCRMLFQCERDLNKHIGQRPYKCAFCGQSFHDQELLNTHICIPTDNLYKCLVCEKSFSEEFYWRAHCLHHGGEEPYKCGTCYETFGCKSALTWFVQIRSGDEFICNTCGKNFCHKKTIRAHMYDHIEDKSYKCDICQKKFLKKDELDRHVMSHKNVMPFKCVICDKIFRSRFELTKHRCVHTTTHKCNHCGLILSSSYRSHKCGPSVTETPLKCATCCKIFNSKHALTRHERSHTSKSVPRDNQCMICAKLIISKETEKPLICISCESSEMTMNHNCVTCGQLFYSELNLRTHSFECSIQKRWLGILQNKII